MRAPLLLGAVVVVVIMVLVVAALRGAGGDAVEPEAPALTPAPSERIAVAVAVTGGSTPPVEVVPRPGEPDQPATRTAVDYQTVRKALAARPGPSSPDAPVEPLRAMPPAPRARSGAKPWW